MADSITIPAGSDGWDLELTLTKTGPDSLKVKVKAWKPESDREEDPPDQETEQPLEDLKSDEDGGKVTGKINLPGPFNPDFTLVISCPDPQANAVAAALGGLAGAAVAITRTPTVTMTITMVIGEEKIVRTMTAEISEEDQNRLKAFIAEADLPRLARAGAAGGQFLLFPEELVRSNHASLGDQVERLAFALLEVGMSLLRDEPEWSSAREQRLRFVSTDPEVETELWVAEGHVRLSTIVPESVAASFSKAFRAPPLDFLESLLFGKSISPTSSPCQEKTARKGDA